MTPAELDEIEQLLKKATTVSDRGISMFADLAIACQFVQRTVTTKMPAVDADLFVSLRNHAPALLAAARRGAEVERCAKNLLFALSRGNQTAAESFVEIAALRAAIGRTA